MVALIPRPQEGYLVHRVDLLGKALSPLHNQHRVILATREVIPAVALEGPREVPLEGILEVIPVAVPAGVQEAALAILMEQDNQVQRVRLVRPEQMVSMELMA